MLLVEFIEDFLSCLDVDFDLTHLNRLLIKTTACGVKKQYQIIPECAMVRTDIKHIIVNSK